jgi:O-antigen ligase
MGLGGYVATSPVVDVPLHYGAAALLGLAIVGSLLVRGIPHGAGWALALTLGFSLATIANDQLGDYSREKTMLLVATIAAFVAPLTLIRTERRANALVVCLFVFSLTVAALAWIFPAAPHRLALAGSNYIGSGRIISLGFAIALLMLILRRGPWLITLPTVLVTGYLSVQTGSRGPLLAAVVSAVVVLVGQRKVRGRATIVAGLFLAAVPATVLLSQSTGYAEARILGLSAAETSVSTRWHYYAEAVNLGLSNPFGIGWGNFGWKLTLPPEGVGTEVYAHNLLLETLSEGGWMALISVLALTIVAIRNLWRVSEHPTWAAVLGLSIYFLMNAMVSSDINGNRIVFSLLALGVLVGRTQTFRPVPDGAN